MRFHHRGLWLSAAALVVGAFGCGGPEACGEDVELCAGRGWSCGAHELVDDCGRSRTLACGGCSADLTCSEAGQCIDRSCEPETDAQLCEAAGYACGSQEVTDGCEQLRRLECGTCSAETTCTAAGRCVDPSCEPEADSELCAAAGRVCGEAALEDRCGDLRTVACGGCTADRTCSEVGQCIDPACEPETDAELCAADGLACGAHERTDGCGQARTIGCGGCDGGRTCSAAGACVDPSCLPETDAELCARLGASCGERTAADDCGDTRTVRCGDPCPPSGAEPGWYGEFEADDPTYTFANESFRLRVVDVGTHYVVAWLDDRGDGSGWSVSEAILSTRVTYDGQVLDPGGVMLFEPGSNQTMIDLLWTGAEAVLVLQEWIASDDRVVSVTRLDAAGRRLDASPAMVARGDLHSVRGLFDGTNVVVAWVQGDASGEWLALRSIAPATLDLGPEQAIRDATGIFPSSPSLAAHGGLPMILWHEWHQSDSTNHLRATTLQSDYAPSIAGGAEIADPLGDLVADRYRQEHLLFSTPDGFALVHSHHDTTDAQRRLHASFFDVAGGALGAEPLLLAERPAADGEYHADAASFGGDWLVTYDSDAGRQALVVDAGGRTLSDGPILLEGTAGGSGDFACHTTECTFGFQDGFPLQSRLLRYAAPAMAPSAPIEAATAAEHQLNPSVAFDGTQYLASWVAAPGSEHPNTADTTRLLMRRLSTDGTWLDPAPLEVPVSDDLYWGHGVTAYPSGGFLVRWVEQTDSFRQRLYVRRMAADGSWAWSAPVLFDLVGTYDYRFGDAVCASEHCLVTVQQTFDPFQYMVVDGAGAIVTHRGTIEGLTEDRVQPTLRHAGDLFYLAFAQGDALHVRSVQASGVEVGQPGAESYEVAAEAEVQRSGALFVEAGGEPWLLSAATVPDASKDSGYRHRTRARAFTPGAGLGSPVTVADDLPWAAQLVGAADDGTELQIFYLHRTETAEQLLRARFDRTGGATVEGPAPYLDEAWFGRARLSGQLLVYSRIDWDVGFGGHRLRLRFIGDRSWLLSDDAACVDDGQCASGRCRSAQCCEECPLWKGL